MRQAVCDYALFSLLALFRDPLHQDEIACIFLQLADEEGKAIVS